VTLIVLQALIAEIVDHKMSRLESLSKNECMFFLTTPDNIRGLDMVWIAETYERYNLLEEHTRHREPTLSDHQSISVSPRGKHEKNLGARGVRDEFCSSCA